MFWRSNPLSYSLVKSAWEPLFPRFFIRWQVNRHLGNRTKNPSEAMSSELRWRSWSFSPRCVRFAIRCGCFTKMDQYLPRGLTGSIEGQRTRVGRGSGEDEKGEDTGGASDGFDVIHERARNKTLPLSRTTSWKPPGSARDESMGMKNSRPSSVS